MESLLKTFSILALLLIATPRGGFAEDKPATATATPAKAASKYTPLYAQVDSVTDTLLTVKGTGPDLKFVINADTKITKDKAHKEAAKATDAQPGQWIGGSYTKAADGSNVLHSLHLGVSQKGGKPGEPKK